MSGPMGIEVSNLRFAYPGQRDFVIDIPDLRIERGEKVLLYGPSGSGKTTLLKALCGLVPHMTGGRFGGRVRVCGHDTRRGIVSRYAGYMWQEPESQCVMTRVWAEVAFGGSNIRGSDFSPASALNALKAVGAAHLTHRPISTLSGGEMQRVVLAAIMNTGQGVWLLDEPTSQIDKDGRRSYYSALRRSNNHTVVMTEHHIPQALTVADRVLKMARGRVREGGKDEAMRYYRRLTRPLPPPEDSGLGDGPPVSIRNLTFNYPGYSVFNTLNLEFPQGLSVVTGPNGSGKSTLARLIARLLHPAKGTIIAPSVRLLLQDPNYYFTSPTLHADLMSQARAAHAPESRVKEVIRVMDLGPILGSNPWEISTGQRVRAAIALLLLSRPDTIVLDEPSRGMDPAHRRSLMRYLSRLTSLGYSVIIFTHDPAIGQMAPWSHRFHINDGEVVEV